MVPAFDEEAVLAAFHGRLAATLDGIERARPRSVRQRRQPRPDPGRARAPARERPAGRRARPVAQFRQGGRAHRRPAPRARRRRGGDRRRPAGPARADPPAGGCPGASSGADVVYAQRTARAGEGRAQARHRAPVLSADAACRPHPHPARHRRLPAAQPARGRGAARVPGAASVHEGPVHLDRLRPGGGPLRARPPPRRRAPSGAGSS